MSIDDQRAEIAQDPKRCPHCNRVAFRTMTDYLCVMGCGWHERHNEPLSAAFPPATRCDGHVRLREWDACPICNPPGGES